MLKRFAYAADPWCLASWALYGVNRFVLDAASKGPFLRNSFNDVLLIPAVLPLILWVQRKVGLRGNDAMPRAGEIALHLIIWSLVAEVLAPMLTTRATADLGDVVAYSAGALIAWLAWGRG